MGRVGSRTCIYPSVAACKSLPGKIQSSSTILRSILVLEVPGTCDVCMFLFLSIILLIHFFSLGIFRMMLQFLYISRLGFYRVKVRVWSVAVPLTVRVIAPSTSLFFIFLNEGISVTRRSCSDFSGRRTLPDTRRATRCDFCCLASSGRCKAACCPSPPPLTLFPPHFISVVFYFRRILVPPHLLPPRFISTAESSPTPTGQRGAILLSSQQPML